MVAKHNLRKYKSEEYSADNIFLIYGTDNLVQDVKAVYHQEFDEALKVYNENQTRADRKIKDYFEHVANKEQDMAVEIIIQVGDRAYWQGHWENKVFMRRIYRMILEELQYQLPQFVVANAVVHMDEDSPHMHVVGIPVGTGCKKGMSKQVSKRTKDVLSIVLQDKLRTFANEKAKIVLGEQIREKSKGRNHDLSVMEYKVLKEEIRYDELKEQADEKQQENEQLKAENSKLRKTLDKAYDFMKQFVVDGRNLLERFLESIGQVIEKVREDFRR